MDKIPFENGTLVTPAKVTINEVEYEVTPAEYTGETPLNAENLNLMQSNIKTAIDEQTTHKYIMKVTTTVAKGGIITIPCKYAVGTGCMDVYLNGQKLLLSSNVAGTDGHYLEVGTADSISNQIKLTSDWGLDADSVAEGRVFEFIVRGSYE